MSGLPVTHVLDPNLLISERGGEICFTVLRGFSLEFDLEKRLQNNSYESRLMFMALDFKIRASQMLKRDCHFQIL